jgi:hypothetical protein
MKSKRVAFANCHGRESIWKEVVAMAAVIPIATHPIRPVNTYTPNTHTHDTPPSDSRDSFFAISPYYPKRLSLQDSFICILLAL